MRVAAITAGAAGMYCGSCMRDNTLARALRAAGVDATLVPTYTPIQTDVEDVSEPRVFYGGIGVYLAQVLPAWRRVPRWVGRLLAAPALLRLASRVAISNRAAGLGELTLSVLRGESGNHARELDELCRWLDAEPRRPDVVHLTNSLLSGLAPALARRLGVPVVCTLQGEDLFLDGLPERHREQALELIRANAEAVRLFVAVSGYYRGHMAGYAGIPAEKIRTVPPAIPREEAEALAPLPERREHRPDRFVIGYLGRLCEEKGLGLVARAFALARRLPGMERARLRIAGSLGPADRPFVERTLADLRREVPPGDVELLGTVDYAEKVAFLGGIDVFSMPAVYREPKGLSVIEAFAAGVPAVLPRHGAFTELVEATGGGLLVDPGSPAALAEAFGSLAVRHDLRADLGRRARRGFEERFTDRRMAEDTLALYREVLGAPALR